MVNTEVINAIETIVKLDVVDGDFPSKELALAIINCDHYVRQGVNREAFMFWAKRIIGGDFPADLVDKNIPYELRIPMTLSGLVRTFFDRKYFEECCAAPVEKVDSVVVKKIIKNFSRKELKGFFTLLIIGRVSGELFIGNSKSDNMWRTINRECREVNHSIPEMDGMSNEYSNFAQENPLYFFDYLSTKRVADIICDSIDKNGQVTEKLARLMRDSGYVAAEKYLINVIESYNSKRSRHPLTLNVCRGGKL